MKIIVVNDTEHKLPLTEKEAWIQKIIKELVKRKILLPEFESKELSLVFLKDAEAKRLNWQHRGKDYATDILSFKGDDPESYGELVFCLDVVIRQAKENQHDLIHELQYLILHGLLHLSGMDHETPGPEAEKMLKLQDEIFQFLIDPPKSSNKSSSKKKNISLKKESKKDPKKIEKKPAAKKTSTKAKKR